MFREIPFEPCPLMGHPHIQTCFSTLKGTLGEPLSTRKIVPVTNGDRIALEISTPVSWTPASPTVLCVHGLCGSHRSAYLVRLAHRLSPLHIRTVRMNLRGSGSGKGLARECYHSGRCEDVFDAVKALKRDHPDSPIILLGFSLGGNLVLKMMGDLGSLGKVFVDKTIAIVPPVDLLSSCLLFPHAGGGMYEKYFYQLLRSNVYELQNMFKGLPKISLPLNLSIYEFDRIYTAPRMGFGSPEDYYAKCSALYVMEEISSPCKILLAEDDPIVAHTSLDHLHLPSNIEIYKTKKGGHMGYLGHPSHPRGFYWLDSLLEEWILEKKSSS